MNIDFNANYFCLLLITSVVAGWILHVKISANENDDFIYIHETSLYGCLENIPLLLILLSIIINNFVADVLSSFIYIVSLVVIGKINSFIIYPIYRVIFGYSGIGTLIPMIAVIPLLVFLYIALFN